MIMIIAWLSVVL